MKPLRELLRCGRQPLRDNLPVAINVARRIEKDSHDGKSLDRRGTHSPYAGHTADGVLNGSGDEDLDLFRRQPYGFRLDADLGRRKLGEDVIFGAAKCVDPIGDQNAGKRGDNAAESNRQSNNGSLRT